MQRFLFLLFRLCAAGNGIAHLGVGDHILHVVIIHYAQLAFAERGGDGARHLCLGLDHAGAHALHFSLVFLLLRNGHGAAFFRLGLRDALVGLRLVDLELCADVAANVHVRDVDGKDLERGAGVKALVEHRLGDQIRVFKNVLMGLGGTDRGNDAFTDTGDDGLLARTADETVDVRADGHARLGAQRCRPWRWRR